MAASESVSPVELLREQVEGASPDVLRAMIKTFAQVVPLRPGRIRTCGLGIRSPLLYPLSYGRAAYVSRAEGTADPLPYGGTGRVRTRVISVARRPHPGTGLRRRVGPYPRVRAVGTGRRERGRLRAVPAPGSGHPAVHAAGGPGTAFFLSHRAANSC